MAATHLDCDVVIIGAGVAGLCALYRLRECGLEVVAIERGADVGGVWYWNRYPGARFDSESYTYCYSFAKALLAEWDWQERFAAQPEVYAYLKRFADRYGLRPAIRFDTEVLGTEFDERANAWRTELSSGETLSSRFLVSGAGALSAIQLPQIESIGSFAGASHHTSRWPHEGVDFANKRVGVIGTGATGVQVIQTIAPEVAELTVFQRTANFCVPQRNSKLDDAERAHIREHYDDIWQRCRTSYAGFLHAFDERSGLEVTDAERNEKFEKLWQQPGFAFWFGNFRDLMMDARVNEHASDFLRTKIRERVVDPEVANKLMPRHPFGTKRVPLENGYYEAYNRPNVKLVDLKVTPIQRIVPEGVVTSGNTHPLDVLVFATGFDATTGALTRMNIRGEGGATFEQKWHDGARTYLGIGVPGFPNFFALSGPHNAASLCNAVVCTEVVVDWVRDCISHTLDHGYSRVDVAPEAAREWTTHVHQVAAMTVLDQHQVSWFYGANTPGKKHEVLVYAGGALLFRQHCEQAAREGYPGLTFS